MTKPTIFAVIPEPALKAAIATGLFDDYAVDFSDDLDVLFEQLENGQPDLILCHQILLEEDQALVLSRLKITSKGAQILVIGPRQPLETQIKALKYGARGYFDSALPITKLMDAIHDVLHGEVWIERHVISGLIDELVHVPELTEEQRLGLDSLSPKELEVAKLVSHGATNKMIANKLAITERTVKAHLTAIFQKMAISDRLSLAIFFRDLR
jgi:DNA-binding NarL/FixJ family response regulator